MISLNKLQIRGEKNLPIYIKEKKARICRVNPKIIYFSRCYFQLAGTMACRVALKLYLIAD